MSVIRALSLARLPLFGICLGQQSIGAVFGGKVVRAPSVMHGKTSPVHHTGEGVFTGLPSPLHRYALPQPGRGCRDAAQIASR